MRKDKVFLEGEQKEIDPWYHRAKLFAFTSSSEGYPNVVGEALSAGLPVVAYDCIAGPSDMIDDGKTGILFRFSSGKYLWKNCRN
jgi:glycosyltransferase involved in cell wall biosynthesis